MRERLLGYVGVPLHVLPTGIPIERFRGCDGAAFRAQHGIAPERPVALFVGRVAHEKNIGFLLDALPQALRRRPDVLLLIAGEGRRGRSWRPG
jgi:glycosyltransferase involved in cell wall biosynthesis